MTTVDRSRQPRLEVYGFPHSCPPLVERRERNTASGALPESDMIFTQEREWVCAECGERVTAEIVHDG